MKDAYIILALMLFLVSATYMIIPTFFWQVGIRWFHQYKVKKWILRWVGTIFYILYIQSEDNLGLAIIWSFVLLILYILSFLHSPSSVFTTLNEQDLIRKNTFFLSEEVVGIVHKDKYPMAYPLRQILIPRHIINDSIYDDSIAITYCAACKSTMIFETNVLSQRLTFQVLGVYRRNMVMMDMQTGSIWQQATGNAIYGRLKGTQMKALPYQIMRWKDWLSEYPTTVVVEENIEYDLGLISKNVLTKMLKITDYLIPPGKIDLGNTNPMEMIWGVEVMGQQRAYPLSILRKNKVIKDEIGGIPIEIHYDNIKTKISGYRVHSGISLTFSLQRWAVWKEFHPETDIYKNLRVRN